MERNLNFQLSNILLQLLYIPSNPFTWDESSKLVTTSILDVKVKHAKGGRQLINVSNLSEEIAIQIPFATLLPAPTLDVFFKEADNESIQYHTFEVEETGKAIEFYVKPQENQEKMTILIKYGEKPTMLEYDMNVKLPNYSSCVFTMTSSFEDGNCSENPYSIFLPSTYLTQIGTYYVGVKYDIAIGNVSSTQSRRKRDCGGGGRWKRSCIKYKDPPPTEPSNGKFVQQQQGYDKFSHSNYTMEQLVLGCNFWNPPSNQFSSGGCRVRQIPPQDEHVQSCTALSQSTDLAHRPFMRRRLLSVRQTVRYTSVQVSPGLSGRAVDLI